MNPFTPKVDEDKSSVVEAWNCCCKVSTFWRSISRSSLVQSRMMSSAPLSDCSSYSNPTCSIRTTMKYNSWGGSSQPSLLRSQVHSPWMSTSDARTLNSKTQDARREVLFYTYPKSRKSIEEVFGTTISSSHLQVLLQPYLHSPALTLISSSDSGMTLPCQAKWEFSIVWNEAQCTSG